MISHSAMGARWLISLAAFAWASTAAAQDFSGQDLSGVRFENISFVGANFSETNLSDAFFRDCDLRDTDFSNATLDFSTFIDVDLRGATFAGSISGPGPIFLRVDAREVIATPVSWIQASFRDSNCSGMDFTTSDVFELEIRTSICTGVNLSVIDGTGSIYPDSDLTGASFERAIVRNAIFGNTNLTNANFVNATITGADFSTAIVDGIRF